jgi:DNA-binding winged helix-turn-helix (wHTH) protein
VRVQFVDFVLDSGGRRLLRRGRDVPLSPKAFLLLELLASKRPNAVSKSEILDLIWPDTHIVEANIANLVGEIRSALNDDRRQARYIRTVPRFGYAFIHERVGRTESTLAFSLAIGDKRYWLRAGVTELGRSTEGDGVFDSSTISREHARIVVDGASATIEDLGSKNGTFVGTTRVVSQVELRDGDIVRLGSVKARFCCETDDGSTLTDQES